MRRYLNLLKRDVDGVLLLDKPAGFSSSFFLNKIKKLFCANKAGYCGTLDPIATGMLPICFGKSTNISRYLLNADKKYIVFMKLGKSTNTFDLSGMIIYESLTSNININVLKKCLKLIQGYLYQIPPMFSSIKYKGLPLYKYARKGVIIPRKSRVVYIYDIRIVSKKEDVVGLHIHCSKGTYIRSVINDIGEILGCGAHVISLRRLTVGKYIASSMINIKTLESIFYNSNFNDVEVLERFDRLLISI